MAKPIPAPRRHYHEPVPAYMQRLTMMGARFINGNDGTGATGGSQGNDGGSSNESAAQQQGSQQQPNDQGQPAAPAPAESPAPESPEQQDQGQQGLENASRDDLINTIRELRRENARRRTSTQEATQTAAEQAQQSVVEQIGKALGLIDDGDNTPDAEKLTQQLTQQTQAAKQAQLELAVYRAASTHGADADALLDSRSFLEKVQGIDPSKTADIEAAIQDAVKDNPRLQTGQAPPTRSSAPLNNSNSQPVAQTPEELAKLIPRGF